MMDWFIVSIVIAGFVVVSSTTDDYDYAKNQLKDYKTSTDGSSIPLMTNDNGEPIEHEAATRTVNTNIVENRYYLDALTHMNRERIPERVVHAKGLGAFGYFEVTNNVTQYCRAKFLEQQCIRIPAAVRFSWSFNDRGSPDSQRDSLAMAVKLYTEEGNLDLIGFNIPVFTMRDPVHIAPFIHVNKRNPVTNLPDTNAIWDYVIHHPEYLNNLIHVLSDKGNPDGFRNIDSFMIHTYEVENSAGDLYYVRFTFLNEQGSNYVTRNVSNALSVSDPYYYGRDLYNAIARGDYPSWTLNMQVMTYEQLQAAPFDAISVTKYWPEEQYPYIQIGRLVLNRNPTNYFNDVEQATYSPGNLVPGINGGMDSVYQTRAFAYKDAHYHRLGANFYNLPVNRPLNKIASYNRAGVANLLNYTAGPNYYPNSFNGPEAYVFANRNSKSLIGKLEAREKVDDDDVLGQSSTYYESLSSEERQRIASLFAVVLGRVTDTAIQDKSVELLTELHAELGATVRTTLDAASST